MNVESMQRLRCPHISKAIANLPGGASIVSLQELKRAPNTGPAYVAGKRAYLNCMEEGRAGCALLLDPEFEVNVRHDMTEELMPGRILQVVLAGRPLCVILSCYGPTRRSFKVPDGEMQGSGNVVSRKSRRKHQ
jgi:hypothetical protein